MERKASVGELAVQCHYEGRETWQVQRSGKGKTKSGVRKQIKKWRGKIKMIRCTVE